MASRRDQLKKEIDELVAEGRDLFRREAKYWRGWKDEDSPSKDFSFPTGYHLWYSPALRVVKQLLPERLDEFAFLYRDTRAKEMTLATFGVHDHITGVVMLRHPRNEWAWQALQRFSSQIAILASAGKTLDSLLGDSRGVLQADLFDNEISASRDLLKKKHLRAAGAVAGVVLEGHLAYVARERKLPIRKRAPTIGDLNDPLREAGAYDVPEWRRIQRLADIRNLAVHQKERNPTQDEIQELIEGAERVIKSVF